MTDTQKIELRLILVCVAAMLAVWFVAWSVVHPTPASADGPAEFIGRTPQCNVYRARDGRGTYVYISEGRNGSTPCSVAVVY